MDEKSERLRKELTKMAERDGLKMVVFVGVGKRGKGFAIVETTGDGVSRKIAKFAAKKLHETAERVEETIGDDEETRQLLDDVATAAVIDMKIHGKDFGAMSDKERAALVKRALESVLEKKEYHGAESVIYGLRRDIEKRLK